MLSDLRDKIFGKGRLLAPLACLTLIVCAVIIALIYSLPPEAKSAEGAILSAGVAATIAILLYGLNRNQGKRNTTLDLFREYYSTDFATQRRRAGKFMSDNAGIDFHKVNPYTLGSSDELEGYGSVLRYWQRAALLFEEGEVDQRLLQHLLARELAHFRSSIFARISGNPVIYVCKPIGRFIGIVANGRSRDAFNAGERDEHSLKMSSTSLPN